MASQLLLKNVTSDWVYGLVNTRKHRFVSWVPLHDARYRALIFADTLPLEDYQKEHMPPLFTQVVGKLTEETEGYLVVVYPDYFSVVKPVKALLIDDQDRVVAEVDMHISRENPCFHVAYFAHDVVAMGDIYTLKIMYNDEEKGEVQTYSET